MVNFKKHQLMKVTFNEECAPPAVLHQGFEKHILLFSFGSFSSQAKKTQLRPLEELDGFKAFDIICAHHASSRSIQFLIV